MRYRYLQFKILQLRYRRLGTTFNTKVKFPFQLLNKRTPPSWNHFSHLVQVLQKKKFLYTIAMQKYFETSGYSDGETLTVYAGVVHYSKILALTNSQQRKIRKRPGSDARNLPRFIIPYSNSDLFRRGHVLCSWLMPTVSLQTWIWKTSNWLFQIPESRMKCNLSVQCQ